MSDIIQYQGDDLEVNIEVLDGGVAMDIDALKELYVYIIQSDTEKIEAKYSKAGAGDHIALTKVTATMYKFWIDSSITSATKGGDLNIEVNVVESEAELTDGDKNSIAKEKLIQLNTSQIKAES